MLLSPSERIFWSDISPSYLMQINNLRLRKILRGIAFFTLVTFVCNECTWAVPQPTILFESSREIKTAENFPEIPAELGSITEKFSDRPSLFILPDAHGHYQAQKTTEQLLEFLKTKRGLGSLFIEGGSGMLDSARLEFFDDPALNLRTADVLMREAEIGGAERFALKNPGVAAYGIEDMPLYLKNLSLYREVLSARDITGPWLDKTQLEIRKEASRSGSAEFFEFFKTWAAYEDEQIDLYAYLSRLEERALKSLGLNLRDARAQLEWPMLVRFFELKNREKKLHEKKTEEQRARLEVWAAAKKIPAVYTETLNAKNTAPGFDRRRFWEEFYREASPLGFRFENYPDLSAWEGFRILEREIEAGALMHEVERLRDRIAGSLSEKGRGREILEKFRAYLLLKKMFSLSVTPDEYRSWQKTAGTGMPFKLSSPLERIYRRAAEFYALAFDRDAIMAREILSAKKPGGTGAVIAGGFHTEGLCRLLREKKIGYAVVMPHVSAIEDGKKYEAAMTGAKRRLDFGAARDASSVRVPQWMMPQEKLPADIQASRSELKKQIEADGVSRGAKLRSEVRMAEGRHLGKKIKIKRFGDQSYTVTELLGRGESVEIYRAVPGGSSYPELLIQIFNSADAADAELLKEKVSHENSVMLKAGMDNPFVPDVHGISLDSGSGYSYLASEYIPGVSLRKWMRGKSDTDKLLMAYRLLRAVSSLHRGKAKVVHLNLKPSNFIVTPDGRLKIADFSIAQEDGKPAPFRDRSLSRGTPQYMAPEMFERGSGPYDFSTDVYMLAETIYELASGMPLFSSVSPEDYAELHQAQVSATELASHLPAAWKDLVPILRKALDRESKNRYENAFVMMNDFEDKLPPALRPQALTDGSSHVGKRADINGKTYLIERFVERGTFSWVFEGMQIGKGGRRLGRVALKVYRNIGYDDIARKELDAMNEYHKSGKAFVPKPIGIGHIEGEQDQLHVLGMEFVDGQELQDWVKGKTPDEIADMTLKILEAVATLHPAIVHQDLKLSNIMISENRPKIVDLGVARFGDSLGKIHRPRGAPRYAAPEVLENRSRLSPRVDVYSLGMVVYFMMLGEEAFPSPGNLIEEKKSPPKASDIRAALTMTGAENEELWRPAAEVVVRAMNPDPSKRYADADEMLKALRGALSRSELRHNLIANEKELRKTIEDHLRANPRDHRLQITGDDGSTMRYSEPQYSSEVPRMVDDAMRRAAELNAPYVWETDAQGMLKIKSENPVSWTNLPEYLAKFEGQLPPSEKNYAGVIRFKGKEKDLRQRFEGRYRVNYGNLAKTAAEFNVSEGEMTEIIREMDIDLNSIEIDKEQLLRETRKTKKGMLEHLGGNGWNLKEFRDSQFPDVTYVDLFVQIGIQDELRAKILRYFEAYGGNRKATADKLGVPPDVFESLVKAYSIPLEQAKSRPGHFTILFKLSQDDIEKLADRAGWSVPVIAKRMRELDRAFPEVSPVALIYGLALSEPFASQYARLRRARKDAGTIATFFGVTTDELAQMVRELIPQGKPVTSQAEAIDFLERNEWNLQKLLDSVIFHMTGNEDIPSMALLFERYELSAAVAAKINERYRHSYGNADYTAGSFGAPSVKEFEVWAAAAGVRLAGIKLMPGDLLNGFDSTSTPDKLRQSLVQRLRSPREKSGFDWDLPAFREYVLQRSHAPRDISYEKLFEAIALISPLKTKYLKAKEERGGAARFFGFERENDFRALQNALDALKEEETAGPVITRAAMLRRLDTEGWNLAAAQQAYALANSRAAGGVPEMIAALKMEKDFSGKVEAEFHRSFGNLDYLVSLFGAGSEETLKEWAGASGLEIDTLKLEGGEALGSNDWVRKQNRRELLAELAGLGIKEAGRWNIRAFRKHLISKFNLRPATTYAGLFYAFGMKDDLASEYRRAVKLYAAPATLAAHFGFTDYSDFSVFLKEMNLEEPEYVIWNDLKSFYERHKGVSYGASIQSSGKLREFKRVVEERYRANYGNQKRLAGDFNVLEATLAAALEALRIDLKDIRLEPGDLLASTGRSKKEILHYLDSIDWDMLKFRETFFGASYGYVDIVEGLGIVEEFKAKVGSLFDDYGGHVEPVMVVLHLTHDSYYKLVARTGIQIDKAREYPDGYLRSPLKMTPEEIAKIAKSVRWSFPGIEKKLMELHPPFPQLTHVEMIRALGLADGFRAEYERLSGIYKGDVARIAEKMKLGPASMAKLIEAFVSEDQEITTHDQALAFLKKYDWDIAVFRRRVLSYRESPGAYQEIDMLSLLKKFELLPDFKTEFTKRYKSTYGSLIGTAKKFGILSHVSIHPLMEAAGVNEAEIALEKGDLLKGLGMTHEQALAAWSGEGEGEFKWSLPEFRKFVAEKSGAAETIPYLDLLKGLDLETAFRGEVERVYKTIRELPDLADHFGFQGSNYFNVILKDAGIELSKLEAGSLAPNIGARNQGEVEAIYEKYDYKVPEIVKAFKKNLPHPLSFGEFIKRTGMTEKYKERFLAVYTRYGGILSYVESELGFTRSGSGGMSGMLADLGIGLPEGDLPDGWLLWVLGDISTPAEKEARRQDIAGQLNGKDWNLQWLKETVGKRSGANFVLAKNFSYGSLLKGLGLREEYYDLITAQPLHRFGWDNTNANKQRAKLKVSMGTKPRSEVRMWDKFKGVTVTTEGGQKFRIRRYLSEGAYGWIYKADGLDGAPQTAAVKIYAMESDPERVERAIADTTGAYQHMKGSNFVPEVYGVGTIHLGSHHWRFIVSEYVDGKKLGAWAKGKKSGQIFSMLRRLLDELIETQKRKVVHRDIKPDNILVRNETPVLIDWDFSRFDGGLGAPVSIEARDAGTPFYTPPSFLENGGYADFSHDTYSLGVIFYELLTEESPFGDWMLGTTKPSAPPASLIEFYLEARGAEFLEAGRPFIPVIVKALNEGYRNAEEMKADLDAVQPRSEVRAAPAIRNLTDAANVLLPLYERSPYRVFLNQLIQFEEEGSVPPALLQRIKINIWDRREEDLAPLLEEIEKAVLGRDRLAETLDTYEQAFALLYDEFERRDILRSELRATGNAKDAAADWLDRAVRLPYDSPEKAWRRFSQDLKAAVIERENPLPEEYFTLVGQGIAAAFARKKWNLPYSFIPGIAWWQTTYDTEFYVDSENRLRALAWPLMTRVQTLELDASQALALIMHVWHFGIHLEKGVPLDHALILAAARRFFVIWEELRGTPEWAKAIAVDPDYRGSVPAVTRDDFALWIAARILDITTYDSDLTRLLNAKDKVAKVWPGGGTDSIPYFLGHIFMNLRKPGPNGRLTGEPLNREEMRRVYKFAAEALSITDEQWREKGFIPPSQFLMKNAAVTWESFTKAGARHALPFVEVVYNFPLLAVPYSMRYQDLTKSEFEGLQDGFRKDPYPEKYGELSRSVVSRAAYLLWPPVSELFPELRDFLRERISDGDLAALQVKAFSARSEARTQSNFFFNKQVNIPGGPYTLKRLINTGGYAWIFEASNPGGKKIAVKIFKLDSLENDYDRIDTLIRHTFAAAAKIKKTTPGFVPEIYGRGEIQASGRKWPYIAMEYIPGQTLLSWIEGKSELEILDMTVKAAEEVNSLHRNKILHKDLKPKNILVTGGEPKIVDWELSRFDEEIGTAQVSLSDAGTPAYMSPSFLKGTGHFDFAEDMYSFGVMLYFLATGQMLFDDPDTSVFYMSPEFLAAKENPPGAEEILQRFRDKSPETARVWGPVAPLIAKAIREEMRESEEMLAGLKAAQASARSELRAGMPNRRDFMRRFRKAAPWIAAASAAGLTAAAVYRWQRPAPPQPPQAVDLRSAWPGIQWQDRSGKFIGDPALSVALQRALNALASSTGSFQRARFKSITSVEFEDVTRRGGQKTVRVSVQTQEGETGIDPVLVRWNAQTSAPEPADLEALQTAIYGEGLEEDLAFKGSLSRFGKAVLAAIPVFAVIMGIIFWMNRRPVDYASKKKGRDKGDRARVAASLGREKDKPEEEAEESRETEEDVTDADVEAMFPFQESVEVTSVLSDEPLLHLTIVFAWRGGSRVQISSANMSTVARRLSALFDPAVLRVTASGDSRLRIIFNSTPRETLDIRDEDFAQRLKYTLDEAEMLRMRNNLSRSELRPGIEVAFGGKLYDLMSELGHGGFARIFEAEEKKSGERVAVKFFLRNEADDLRSARREIRLLEKTGEANLASVPAMKSHAEYAGNQVIVMDLVRGQKLGLWLIGKSDEEKIEMMEKIIRAFQEIHALGIRHGDVKPDNIMITYANEVKVVDLGLGGMGDDPFIAATPNYAAPEMLEMPGRSFISSDVYGLAEIFFEMMTFRRLFPQVQLYALRLNKLTSSFDENYMRGLLTEHEIALLPFVPMLSKSLQLNPAARYADAGEMLAAFSETAARQKRMLRFFQLLGLLKDKKWLRQEPGYNDDLAFEFDAGGRPDMKNVFSWDSAALAEKLRILGDIIRDRSSKPDEYEPLAQGEALLVEQVLRARSELRSGSGLSEMEQYWLSKAKPKAEALAKEGYETVTVHSMRMNAVTFEVLAEAQQLADRIASQKGLDYPMPARKIVHELIYNMLNHSSGGALGLRIIESEKGPELEIVAWDNSMFGMGDPEALRLRSAARRTGGAGFRTLAREGNSVEIVTPDAIWRRNAAGEFEQVASVIIPISGNRVTARVSLPARSELRSGNPFTRDGKKIFTPNLRVMEKLLARREENFQKLLRALSFNPKTSGPLSPEVKIGILESLLRELEDDINFRDLRDGVGDAGFKEPADLYLQPLIGYIKLLRYADQVLVQRTEPAAEADDFMTAAGEFLVKPLRKEQAAALAAGLLDQDPERFERRIRTVYDFYLFYHLSLLSVRVSEDTRKNYPALMEAFRRFQAAHAGGQPLYAADPAWLTFFPSSQASANEGDYTDLERDMVKIFPEYSRFSAAAVGRHLRTVFERKHLHKLTPGVVDALRLRNAADYAMLVVSLTDLWKKYEAVKNRATNDPEKKRLVEALLAAIAGDAELLTSPERLRALKRRADRQTGFEGSSLRRIETKEIETYIRLMEKNRDDLWADIEARKELHPAPGKFSPLGAGDLYTSVQVLTYALGALMDPDLGAWTLEDDIVDFNDDARKQEVRAKLDPLRRFAAYIFTLTEDRTFAIYPYRRTKAEMFFEEVRAFLPSRSEVRPVKVRINGKTYKSVRGVTEYDMVFEVRNDSEMPARLMVKVGEVHEEKILEALGRDAILKDFTPAFYGEVAGFPVSHADLKVFAMEKLEGETLGEWLEGDFHTLEEILDMAEKILKAYSVFHGEGVIHRDLKPENIFITADGKIRLIDFESSQWRKMGLLPSIEYIDALYMAPEDGDVLRVAVPSSDVYSLGLVLIRMLKPEGDLPLPGDIIRTQLTGVQSAGVSRDLMIEEIKKFLRTDAQDLAPWLSGALRNDPAERYADAGAMLKALPSAARSEARMTPDEARAQFAGKTIDVLGKTYTFSKLLKVNDAGMIFTADPGDKSPFLAVKIIPKDNYATGDYFRRMIDHEVRVMKEAEGRRSVKFLEVKFDERFAYISMEYAGRSLASLITKPDLPLKQRLFFSRRAVFAVRDLHKHNPVIVHLDIKPDNLLYQQSQSLVKIADFGIAQIGPDRSPFPPGESGIIQGTAAYMPPEMFENSSEPFSPSTDVFLLGATLFEILTGHRLFTSTGWAQSMYTRRYPVSEEELEDRLPAGIREKLGPVLRKALDVDPSQRYPDAAALEQDFKDRMPEAFRSELRTAAAPSEENWVKIRWDQPVIDFLLKHQDNPIFPKVRKAEPAGYERLYVSGVDMERWAGSAGSLSDEDFEKQIVQWALQIGEAVLLLGNAGLEHGDLKPKNVVIAQNNQPVLIDFSDEVISDIESIQYFISTPLMARVLSTMSGIVDAKVVFEAVEKRFPESRTFSKKKFKTVRAWNAALKKYSATRWPQAKSEMRIANREQALAVAEKMTAKILGLDASRELYEAMFPGTTPEVFADEAARREMVESYAKLFKAGASAVLPSKLLLLLSENARNQYLDLIAEGFLQSGATQRKAVYFAGEGGEELLAFFKLRKDVQNIFEVVRQDEVTAAGRRSKDAISVSVTAAPEKIKDLYHMPAFLVNSADLGKMAPAVSFKYLHHLTLLQLLAAAQLKRDLGDIVQSAEYGRRMGEFLRKVGIEYITSQAGLVTPTPQSLLAESLIRHIRSQELTAASA